MTTAVLAPTLFRYDPPEGTTARGLVAVLHGVGSSASVMAPLADRIAHDIPGLSTVAPEGHELFDGGHTGRQWFSVSGVTDDNRPARISAALPALRAVLDRELDRAGLDWDRLGVVGFSQGAMMALALAAEANPPAAVAAIAGRLASPVAGTAPRRPPVLILHGAMDAVVPVACAEQAASALTTAGFSVEVEIATGQGHSLSHAQTRRITGHLAEAFANVRRDGAA